MGGDTDRREPPLEPLADAAAALAGSLDLETVLDTIVRVATEATGARYAALGVIGTGETISRFVTAGAPAGTAEAIGHYPTGLGLLGLLIRHPQVLRLERVRHPETRTDQRLARLTPTEERIVEMIASGLTNREIGERIHLAEKTVKNYVSTVLTKLEVARRAEAAVYWSEHRSRAQPGTSGPP